MGSIHKTPYFFRAKPLFGLDIGQSSLKITQLSFDNPAKPRLLAYGSASFDRKAIKNGVIVEPEVIAKATRELMKKNMIGEISSRRVSLAIPSFRTFTRSMKLPKLKPRELADAVRL